jgi:hypothetical protein
MTYDLINMNYNCQEKIEKIKTDKKLSILFIMLFFLLNPQIINKILYKTILLFEILLILFLYLIYHEMIKKYILISR